MSAMSDTAKQATLHLATDLDGPVALKPIHTKEEKEKHDEPKADPPESDDFGLPHRPPRRRTYTLESLDSPDEIKKQVIDETGGEMRVPQGTPEETQDAPRSVENSMAEAEDGEMKKEAEAPSTPRRGTVDTPLAKIQSPTSPSSARRPKSPSSVRSPISPSSARSPTSPNSKHKHQTSVSEWSHQQVVPRESMEKAESSDDEKWQDMPAFATHRVYDDWGKVLAKEYDEMDDQTFAYGNLGGAGKGYSRVLMDEDAQSATSMDDNTAYLFKEKYAANTLYEDDEDSRDVLSQMQTNKELLTDGQKVAYVGVVRLALADMGKDLEKLERGRQTKKAVDFAVEALKMWGQKIMLRLYHHMEIDSREQIMVEQLAEHGVLPSDLTPALMANARVKNPNASSNDASRASSARPSIASPRPTSAMDGRKSSIASSKPSTPAPNPESLTPGSEDPPPAYEQHTADELTIQDPDELEHAKNLDIDIRWTVLCDLFLLLIADSSYDARARVLLERVGSALSVEWQEICRFEKRVTDAIELQEETEKENWNEDEHLEARRKQARNKRLMVMGLCTVGGGLVIGLSAGLLAPVIGAGLAAGFTAVGVSGTGTFLGGTGAAALIGTTGALIGGRSGLTTSNRRTGSVKTYEYKPLYNNKRANLIVTVAGWMTGKVDDVRLPFSTVSPIMGDIYSVNWEPEMLQSTGQTIQILGTEALTQTIQQILGATVLATLMAGLSTPIVLLKITYLIDNPWTTALARGDATGLVLADSIIDRNLGLRPITLVGFSLGSRVIWSCLKELARRGAVGLVQNVYMFGSPVVAKREDYIRARSVVSGRFVNGYTTNDWILGYLFRATGGGVMQVAGLSKVVIPGIENIDVTEDVPGHMAYRGMMPTLLDKVGWQMESLEYTEIEDPDPENHAQRQRELLNEIEEARKQLDDQPEKKGFKAFFTRKKAPQKKVWETYDERNQKVLEGDEEQSAAHAEENANVMFDVEAIRKEALALALQSPGDIEEIKKHLSVKEIASTLPALKVTMPPNGTTGPDRPDARQAHSHDGTTTVLPNGTSSSAARHASNDSYLHDPDPSDGDIALSFEEDRPSFRSSSSNEPSHSWHHRPPTSTLDTPNDRPPLRSLSTSPAPMVTSHFPTRISSAPAARPQPHQQNAEREGGTSPDHNPWSADADSPNFGREREMKMDFE